MTNDNHDYLPHVSEEDRLLFRQAVDAIKISNPNDSLLSDKHNPSLQEATWEMENTLFDQLEDNMEAVTASQKLSFKRAGIQNYPYHCQLH